MSLRALIASDWARYLTDGTRPPNRVRALLSQGWWAVFVYRLGHQTRAGGGLWHLGYPLAVLGYKVIELTTGISLQPDTKVGRGCYISHFGQIIIASTVEIGDNCNIGQGVTLGLGRKGRHWGAPRIGNRVFIGANAVIYGPVTIGDDAAIGPNCVVSENVPPRAVLRVPEPIVSGYRGSFAWVRYPGSQDDPERRASLANGRAEEG